MRYPWSLNGPGFPGLGAEERGLGLTTPLPLNVQLIRPKTTTTAPRVVEEDAASNLKALRIARATTETSVTPPTPPPAVIAPPPPPPSVVSTVVKEPVTPAMLPLPVITLKPMVTPTVSVTTTPVTTTKAPAATTVVPASQAPTVAPQVVPGVIQSTTPVTSAPVTRAPSPFTVLTSRLRTPLFRTTPPKTRTSPTPVAAAVQVGPTTTPVADLPKPAQQAATALVTGAATDAALYSTSDVSRTPGPATATVQDAQATVKDAVADQAEPTSAPNTGLLVVATLAAFVLFRGK